MKAKKKDSTYATSAARTSSWPKDKENIDFSNIISMNESSALLWKSVQDKEFTAEDMAQTLMDKLQIDEKTPLTHNTALHDAEGRGRTVAPGPASSTTENKGRPIIVTQK